MEKYRRHMIVIVLLVIAAVLVFVVPTARYESPDVFSLLSLPTAVADWQSRDVSKTFNIRDPRYAFVSEIFARRYVSSLGEDLTFFVLDAGNFHHPKVCFHSSGYEILDLPPVAFTVGDRTVTVPALYMKKEGASFVIIYWITINQVPQSWVGQKMTQLWYSILGREKIGLMMRFDVPVYGNAPARAVATAQQFVKDLAPRLDPATAAYVFGKGSEEVSS